VLVVRHGRRALPAGDGVDDALHSTRAAVEGGIVPGGVQARCAETATCAPPHPAGVAFAVWSPAIVTVREYDRVDVAYR
jgi:hypothetical protein